VCECVCLCVCVLMYDEYCTDTVQKAVYIKGSCAVSTSVSITQIHPPSLTHILEEFTS